MHLAAAQRSVRGISLLLANGASVNATDHRGRTPLHVACESCHNDSRGGGDSDVALLECIEHLLSSGALEDARDAKGQTPLHLSALAGNLSAAQALLAAGATVVADDAGNSPLHLAAAQGNSDILQLLVVGKRDEPPPQPNTSASISSEAETREQSRPPVAVGGLQSVFDVDVSSHERGPGIVSAERHESSPTTTNGEEAFGDDDVAVRTDAAPGRQFRATENYPNVSGDPAEDKISSREAHSRYPEPGVLSLEDGPTASVGNNHSSWGGPSSLNSVPDDQQYPLGQRWDAHDSVGPRWQGQADSHSVSVETSIRSAGRISEDGAGGRHGHHAAENEHRRRRPRGSGSRLSRRHHESAGDDRTLGWPETLPSDEYVQVNDLCRDFVGGDKSNQAKSTKC